MRNSGIALFLTSLVIGCGVWGGWAGCGYGFQNSQNSKNLLVEREGVRRVFIAPIVNNTYKAGVENVVYNALLKTLAARGGVKVVSSREDADAILEGSVGTAQYSMSVPTTANVITPRGLGRSDMVVPSEYSAALNCNFTLTRRIAVPDKKNVIWSSGFSRAKPVPAANQVDVPGTTSALINESEFDRALQDLATSMMTDVHESMLGAF